MHSGSLVMTMKLPRRKFLHLAAGVATLPSLSLVASADDYPTRPVKIVVGFAAGGAVDIVARLIGQWLSDRIGQQCVVENRPGAGNNLAPEYVLKSDPDGYTLLLTNPTNAINATYYENLPYDFIRDSAPVAGIMRVPNVMEVSPLLTANTVPEFIALAKANPGKLAYATGGNGTSVHMSAELFKLLTNTDILNVTYRGLALAYTDLMTNRVQVTFDNLPGSIGFIRQGKLRALAVTTTTRSPALPDLPALAEFIPGYEASAWYGVSVPRKTPQAVIAKLNKEINAGLADPALQARLADLGGMIVSGSPADFGKLVGDETEKWANVIKFAGIKSQ
jgi:tripartite-type tricarboxylate transporter receptor subunit TctC